MLGLLKRLHAGSVRCAAEPQSLVVKVATATASNVTWNPKCALRRPRTLPMIGTVSAATVTSSRAVSGSSPRRTRSAWTSRGLQPATSAQ
jgi:hypothetical protein